MDKRSPHTPASLRVRLGLSQIEVAHRAKVGRSTVIRLERGRSVGLDHLRAIAQALDVTVEELIAAMDAERARRAGAGSAA